MQLYSYNRTVGFYNIQNNAVLETTSNPLWAVAIYYRLREVERDAANHADDPRAGRGLEQSSIQKYMALGILFNGGNKWVNQISTYLPWGDASHNETPSIRVHLPMESLPQGDIQAIVDAQIFFPSELDNLMLWLFSCVPSFRSPERQQPPYFEELDQLFEHLQTAGKKPVHMSQKTLDTLQQLKDEFEQNDVHERDSIGRFVHRQAVKLGLISSKGLDWVTNCTTLSFMLFTWLTEIFRSSFQ